MTNQTIGEKLIRWAKAESSVELLVLIGSHARAEGQLDSADEYSDWDFQIATSRPELFAQTTWLAALDLKSLGYVVRSGRLGSAQKVTVLVQEGVLDLVIIPAGSLRGALAFKNEGKDLSREPALHALTDLAAVLQGGYRILKGNREFGGLYEFVTRNISPARLSDDAVRQLADGFVCDYVSTCRKIRRGELLAAQRWLHHQLAETNFRLLHELRQRENEVSFPDARRLEIFAEPRMRAVEVTALPNAESLSAAADKAAATCCELVRVLVDDAWRWPNLGPLRLRAE